MNQRGYISLSSLCYGLAGLLLTTSVIILISGSHAAAVVAAVAILPGTIGSLAGSAAETGNQPDWLWEEL